MMRITPAFRISAGLVMMTLGLLLASQFLGLLPNTLETRLQNRQQFCESLAIQLSLAMRNDDLSMTQAVLNALVKRNTDIRSAALRRADGMLIAATGAHLTSPSEMALHSLGVDDVRVPIHTEEGRWGTVEVKFLPLDTDSPIPYLDLETVKLMLFVALLGAVLYYVFIRRALKHLDPSSVIPARVKATLDVLAEGVVLIDDSDNIVLANASFAKETGHNADTLLGQTLSDLPWIDPRSGKQVQYYAWNSAIRERETQTGVPMQLRTDEMTVKTFMVNSAPIMDNDGTVRGAIVTFDDVTSIEQTNAQLESMLQLLKDSQDRVHMKNQELQRLASIDPLSGCFNRRSFFERLDVEFERSRRTDNPLCCIMCDIDHFKQVNDQHGHSKGDQVIEMVAAILRAGTRETDIIARYGGEEFSMLLPGMSLVQAHEVAERLRARIESTDIKGIRVTASFGLTDMNPAVLTSKHLLRNADNALYGAKHAGRNRVTVWHATDGSPHQPLAEES